MRWRTALAATCCAGLAGCGGTDEPARTKTAPVRSSEPDAKLGLTARLPPAYREVCAEQAAYAPADARACPPVVPDGRLRAIGAAPFSKRAGHRGGYVADFQSPSLNELGGEPVETNGGHWHYEVSWAPRVERLLAGSVRRPGDARRASECYHLQLAGKPVEACRVVPYEQGGGLHGGHIAYLWSHGRVTYVVSIHGYRNEARARAMTEALVERVLGPAEPAASYEG